MSFSILVATPTAAFGDLIRNSLEESGEYKVDVVHTALEAHESLGNRAYRIAILDSDLENNGMRCLAEELNAGHPEIKLIMIPPDNNPSHAMMEGLACSAYLRKPFYLPDLIDLIGELARGGFSEPGTSAPESNWLKSADLEDLIEVTGARAALVSHADGTAVFGGVLPEGMHGELLDLAGRFWQRPARTDLVRFVRLQGDAQDTLVYLTSVMESGETGLVLLYPVSSPLSKVRGQAVVFVRGLRALAENPRPTAETLVLAPVQAQTEAASPEEKDPFLDCLGEEDAQETAALRNFNLAEMLGAIPSPDPNGKSGPDGGDLFGSDWIPESLGAFQPGLTEINDGVRSSETTVESGLIPAGVQAGNSGMVFEEPCLDADCAVVDEPSLSWEPESEETVSEMPPLDLEAFSGGSMAEDLIFNQPLPKFEEEGSLHLPPNGISVFPLQETGQEDVDSDAAVPPMRPPERESLPETNLDGQENSPEESILPEAAVAGQVHENPVQAEDEEEAQANRPSPLSVLTGLDPLEPSLAGSSLMVYTCVLIPRIPQHYLTRELTERLSQWVQQLCLDQAWRLEGISLRPEYMQWTVQTPDTVLPGSAVKIVRRHTSELIFGQFERLRQQSPSDDFWANDYLIVSGPQPPSAQLLRDYITLTRSKEVGVASGDNTST